MTKDIVRISVQELARRRVTRDEIELIDVRSPGEFAHGHVPGARNVPLGSAESGELARAFRGPSAGLAVICESEGRAKRCCEALLAAGREDVHLVEGGTAAWRAAGFPIERAASARTVISIERQVRIAAGTFVLVGCALGYFVHPGWFGVAAFIGAGLVFAGVTDFCGMGLVLARMPWNQR
jgi:rhodanese-related sulfurtransferase